MTTWKFLLGNNQVLHGERSGGLWEYLNGGYNRKNSVWVRFVLEFKKNLSSMSSLDAIGCSIKAQVELRNS